MLKKVLVAGTFDPPTIGHRDIIEKCAGIFDEVRVCIFINVDKTPMYPLETRKKMLEALCRRYDNVTIDSDNGMTADYAARHGICYTARGLRSSADCDYELLMASVNKKSNACLDTILFPCVTGHEHISSTKARKVIVSGGDLEGLLDASTIGLIREYEDKQ